MQSGALLLQTAQNVAAGMTARSFFFGEKIIMFFTTRTTRRKPIRTAAASLALAVALVGGVGVGSVAVTSEAALAQDVAQEAPDPSDGFREVYSSVVPLVQAETADFEGARAMIPSVVAAIENNRDRDLAGNLILNIGSNLSDRQLQRQGLNLRLDSGLVPAEDLGQFNWFAGNFAFEVQDYDAAREHLNAALEAGYTAEGVDIVNLIARSYTDAGDDVGAYNYLSGAVAAASAEGSPVREAWLRNILQYEYENQLAPDALGTVLMLVGDFPSDDSWQDGLRIMSQTLDVSEDAHVDLYRLMALKGALVDRRDIVDYVETLDPRLLPVEVQSALQIGLGSGAFEASDPYFVEVQGIANTRASVDRNGLETIVSEGRSGDGLDARNAGEVLYSMGEYARAEELFSLALERGYDANDANMNIGINQTMQGKSAEAMATFAAVAGERAPIAALWSKYAESQGAI